MFPAFVNEFGLLDASMERLMGSTSWKFTFFSRQLLTTVIAKFGNFDQFWCSTTVLKITCFGSRRPRNKYLKSGIKIFISAVLVRYTYSHSPNWGGCTKYINWRQISTLSSGVKVFILHPVWVIFEPLEAILGTIFASF